LRKDHLRSDGTDAGNIGQIDARDAVELTPKIKAWIIAVALVDGMLGACWHRSQLLVCAGDRLHESQTRKTMLFSTMRANLLETSRLSLLYLSWFPSLRK